MRRAFTLIEVNLAILIMAGGILAMVSLFSFGYRENSQSREDVAGAAIADAVVSPLMMACSATNLRWSVFKKGFKFPEHGWKNYMTDSSGLVAIDPEDVAEKAFENTMSQMSRAVVDGKDGKKAKLDVKTDFPSDAFSKDDSGKRMMSCGLVVIHEEDSPVVKIAFRATHKPGMLMSMPIYYTEARFQGDPNK